ncbi:MAG: hypothetical protein OEV88_05160 [Gammaproteobacteria bacterium]|nr:hypothetical protein [Gammaproteobacteria bacterium]
MAGCESIPEEAYRLPPSSQGVREAQTRTFEVPAEANILQASVALMQDMDYNFDTIEYPLGVLSGSKTVDADSIARNAGLVAADIALVILAVIGGQVPGGSLYAQADDEIKLTVTMVVLPSLENEGQYTARITIRSELVDKSDHVKKVVMIEDPVVYQEIFEKLSKSLFLEGVQ